MKDKTHGNPRWFHYEEIKAKMHALLGGKCVVCGSTEDLEIDHIRRRYKKQEVTSMFLMCTDAQILKELKKCQLLCHTHHMEKTIRERGQQLVKGKDVHGSISSYRYCRCPLCTKVHSEYCLKWKREDKLRRELKRKERANKHEAL